MPDPEILPASFTFDDRGAVITIPGPDGEPLDILITGKDKLRLSGMLVLTMNDSELSALRMSLPPT